jgi:hypothetical protein
MWEKYFSIFMTLNIYVFKEILLSFKILKISNRTKNPKLFLSCCSCNVSMVRKVLNPYIIHLRYIKKRNLKKLRGCRWDAAHFILFLPLHVLINVAYIHHCTLSDMFTPQAELEKCTYILVSENKDKSTPPPVHNNCTPARLICFRTYKSSLS